MFFFSLCFSYAGGCEMIPPPPSDFTHYGGGGDMETVPFPLSDYIYNINVILFMQKPIPFLIIII